MSRHKRDDDYSSSRKSSNYDKSSHRSRSSEDRYKTALKNDSKQDRGHNRSPRGSRESKKAEKSSSFYDSYKKLKQIQLEKASENGKVISYPGDKHRADIPDHGAKKRKRKSRSNSSSRDSSSSRKRRASKSDKTYNEKHSNQNRGRSSRHSTGKTKDKKDDNRSSQSFDSDVELKKSSRKNQEEKSTQEMAKTNASANPFKKKALNDKTEPDKVEFRENTPTRISNNESSGLGDPSSARLSAVVVKQEPEDEVENVKENEEGVNFGSEMADSVMVKRHPFTIMPCNVLLDLLHYAPFMSNRSVDELRLKYPVSSGKDHFKFNEKYFYEMGSSSRYKYASESSNSCKTNSVFPEKPVHKSELKQLVKRRTSLKERAQRNSFDTEAQIELHEVEKKLAELKAACRKPGIFTGAIEIKPLSSKLLDVPDPENLTVPKDDMFTYSHNFLHDHTTLGFKLMKDMGWIPGKGLGKITKNIGLCTNGQAEKLNLFPADIKFSVEDKLGLCGADETMGSGLLYNQLATMDGKNPVAVLAEHCRVNNWGFPLYELMGESGPLHKRAFHYKVRVNNVDYVPHTGSSSKKQAKSDAATGALFALGLIGTSS